MSDIEQGSASGPGTMHGPDTPPASPTMENLRSIEAQGPPPSRFSEPRPAATNLTFENYQPETGAPQAPTMEALADRDRKLIAAGPPKSPTMDNLRKIEAQGPPKGTL